jgi:hypothetical protein
MTTWCSPFQARARATLSHRRPGETTLASDTLEMCTKLKECEWFIYPVAPSKWIKVTGGCQIYAGWTQPAKGAEKNGCASSLCLRSGPRAGCVAEATHMMRSARARPVRAAPTSSLRSRRSRACQRAARTDDRNGRCRGLRARARVTLPDQGQEL